MIEPTKLWPVMALVVVTVYALDPRDWPKPPSWMDKPKTGIASKTLNLVLYKS